MVSQVLAFLALGVFGSSVFGLPSSNHTGIPGGCGTYRSPSAAAMAEAHFQNHLLEPSTAQATIEVHWHVINTGTSNNPR